MEAKLDKLADKVEARREQLKQGTICPECKVSYLLLQTHRRDLKEMYKCSICGYMEEVKGLRQ